MGRGLIGAPRGGWIHPQCVKNAIAAYNRSWPRNLWKYRIWWNLIEEDPTRIERLMNEIETLKLEIRFVELEDQRRMLRGQLAVIGYLRTRPAPVDKDQFLREVRLRHGIALKALHQLVQDGRVMRTGSGQRGDGYRYGVAATRNGDPAPVDDPTETPEPHLRCKA
jgi:hypothetical protein